MTSAGDSAKDTLPPLEWLVQAFDGASLRLFREGRTDCSAEAVVFASIEDAVRTLRRLPAEIHGWHEFLLNGRNDEVREAYTRMLATKTTIAEVRGLIAIRGYVPGAMQRTRTNQPIDGASVWIDWEMLCRLASGKSPRDVARMWGKMNKSKIYTRRSLQLRTIARNLSFAFQRNAAIR